MGGEELKWHQLKHNQLVSRKDIILVHTVQLKPTMKAQISGRMASICVSDVMTASVNSEMKKCMMIMIIIIIIMNKSQEMTVFGGHQKLTSAMKLRPEN